jgi:uncharacterized membrane protein
MRSLSQDNRNNLRIITGMVNGQGGIAFPGSNDWVCTKNGTGVFIIRFVPLFRDVPVITTVSTSFAIIYLIAAKADMTQINTYRPDNTGTLIDGSFSFHIEGRPL